ncbi:MAG: glutamate-5-semialdehyde dehydrogenase [Myxococcales bacterium]|nr:glutamate-5-semialdehyde dehydrogenase [Myxococcales bacterium]
MSNALPLEQRAEAARRAGHVLARAPGQLRTAALLQLAQMLRTNRDALLLANAQDVLNGESRGMAASFVDRLRLTPARIEQMAVAIEEIAAQDDPVGRIESEVIRPNGLRVARMRIPLGVVAVIYEARPNVTTDAAALAIRSGNAVILRGGSDAQHSNTGLGHLIAQSLVASGLPPASVTVVEDPSRDVMLQMLQLADHIDVVIPRGGEGLIRFVREHSRIPVISHYKGVCHVYLDAAADAELARRIVLNAKTSRVSVCNAAETLLVHETIAPTLLPLVADDLLAAGCTLHACPETLALLGARHGIVAATEEDWTTEHLSLDLGVRIVKDLDAAMDHIATYGSSHTEAIITDSLRAAQRFTTEVQSSCVMVNASTRFADGGELGLGAEIGISTSRLHAYGPMGAEGLTTLRFVVTGTGHIRT